MKRVAWGIVNHADDWSSRSLSLSSDDANESERHCTPSTEISDLVVEFGKMIDGFSGEGPSTIASSALFEISNHFTWQSDYHQIYSLSSAVTKRVSVRTLASAVEDSSDDLSSGASLNEMHDVIDPKIGSFAADFTSVVPAPPKQNFGFNILCLSQDVDVEPSLRDVCRGQKVQAYRSSLFWWILLLIVVPLVLTNAVICWVVSSYGIDTVDLRINATAEETQKLEVVALSSITALKATQAQLSANEVIRDLHVETRLAGWLMFDGMSRSDAFTRMEEKAAQQCREYNLDDTTRNCPFYLDFTTAPCACDWEDLNDLACANVDVTDSRNLQERFFYCQARDFDVATGFRNDASSFGPGVDDSSNATRWWDDVEKVPGARKSVNASGFSTTYDRVRVSSAMALVDIPLYNYVTQMGRPKHLLSTLVAFQADGLVTGYDGCGHHEGLVSSFVSNERNRAFEIAPGLCPEGKFGFDPRCRAWYSTGRALYEGLRQPIHITSPYMFAVEDQFAATATSPIVNPATGEYVGQTLLDFSLSSLRALFTGLGDCISFLITPDEGGTGGDTVIGPNGFRGRKSVPISDLLFASENSSSPRRLLFESSILQSMKNGTSGHAKFSRLNMHGDSESLTLAFEPVSVSGLLPLDPSDVSRGVNVSSVLVYSVGVAFSDDEIMRPGRVFLRLIHSRLEHIRRIYLAVIATVSALFIVFACNVSLSPPWRGTAVLCSLAYIFLRLIDHYQGD